MITTSMSSGTLAKYTANAYATGTVYVARWNVSGKVLDAAGTEVWKDEATSTLGDFLSNSLISTLDGNNAIAKAPDSTDYRVAPGTCGGFAVKIDPNYETHGDSEKDKTDVAIDYRVSIQSSSALPTNLKFYPGVKGENDDEIGKEAEASALKFSSTSNDPTVLEYGTIPLDSSTGTASAKNVYVYWEWPYESGTSSDDGVDNTYGNFADDTGAATLTITCEMVQHNPTNAGTETTTNYFYVAPPSDPE